MAVSSVILWNASVFNMSHSEQTDLGLSPKFHRPGVAYYARAAIDTALQLVRPTVDQTVTGESQALPALETTLDLLATADAVEMALASKNRADALDQARAFHFSLPFDEAERHWLINAFRRAMDQHDQALATSAKPEFDAPRQSGTTLDYIDDAAIIIRRGSSVRISRERLVEEWQSWYTQSGPYAEHPNGANRAANHLLSMAGLILTDE